jgi:hypothetical protein
VDERERNRRLAANIEAAQLHDPDHDRSLCACCCVDCPIDTSRPNTSGRMTLHESLELIRERYGDAIRQLGEQ